MSLRTLPAAVALLALTACGSPGPAPGAPGFEGWYQNRAAPTDFPRYLWQELAPIAQQTPDGERVHLLLLDDAQLQVSLYQQARCVARMRLQGDWREQAFFHKQSYFSGLPPLAWGRQSREAQLRPRGDHLQMLLHQSSFGMFLIIAGGAPDRDSSFSFTRLPTLVPAPDAACPVATPGD